MLEYILGVVSGIAVSVFILNIIPRIFRGKSGHIEKRIDDDIKREGILNKRISELQGELLVARSEVSDSRREIRDVRERIVQAENRVKSTDSLIDKIKKRNKL